MKITLVEKFKGQSWQKWFMLQIKSLGFEKIRSSTYENNGVEIRVLKNKKKYQVVINGELSEELEYTFPHITGKLHP